MIRHLHVGADAAITLDTLAARMNVSRREAEQAVHDARMAGVPIISGSRGLWLATTPQEAREQAARLRTRAIHQIETAQALERAAERMADPLTLWAA